MKNYKRVKILKEELLEKIERLHELEKYQEIIDLIESLPMNN